MAATTDVVIENSLRDSFGRQGYFFRQAAMLTISLGVVMHLLRVIFGNEFALQYVITPTTDRILLIPMVYSAVAGIAVWHRVRFANKVHKAFFTASIAYIAGSVPLHVYCSYIIVDTTPVTWFPMWSSWLLLLVAYPALLTMFWRLRYKG